MKRGILGVLFLVLTVITALWGVSKLQENTSIVPATGIEAPSISQSPPQPSTEERPALPQKLIIPKLRVDTVVEQVGLDSQGKMDVPKAAENVGWYNLGFKPGEIGNAVMAGHLDTVTGAPAVFYNLTNLAPEDRIQVVDQKGKTFNFIVTANVTYSFDQVPLAEIFGPSDKSRLNLITCTGTWDQGSRNYSNRTVVYSKLTS